MFETPRPASLCLAELLYEEAEAYLWSHVLRLDQEDRFHSKCQIKLQQDLKQKQLQALS